MPGVWLRNVLPGCIATETLHDTHVRMEVCRGAMRDQCPDLAVSARVALSCRAYTGDNGSFAKICCLEKRGRIAYPYTRIVLIGLTKQGVHLSDKALDMPAR